MPNAFLCAVSYPLGTRCFVLYRVKTDKPTSQSEARQQRTPGLWRNSRRLVVTTLSAGTISTDNSLFMRCIHLFIILFRSSFHVECKSLFWTVELVRERFFTSITSNDDRCHTKRRRSIVIVILQVVLKRICRRPDAVLFLLRLSEGAPGQDVHW